MGKHIQLHIPEPCHESWNKMTPVEKGRFCGSCQKQVVDFTNMKDEQLIAFFKRQSTGSVCGRFMQDQLDRSMEIPKKRIPWVKYFFQFALPAFLLSKKVSAQGDVRVITGDTVVMPATPKIQAVKKAGSNHEKERLVRGRVIDEVGEGISYATIFIKGTTIGVAADSAGNFSLKYSGQENSIVLVSSSIGYEEVETEVDLTKTDKSITASLPADNMLNDVIVVASPDIRCQSVIMGGAFGVAIETTSFIDTIWYKIFPVKQPLNIYPNPVKNNSLLTIEIGKNEIGSHLFQLLSASGQIILTKKLRVEKDSRFIKINIPSVAVGAYFLQVINMQSGKRTTEKIIVE
jgi:CarboxypepD_reg-like domain/Secretion system C-terminal sorting domain